MLTRRTLILAKTEVTEGTDALPTAALNALLVSNCTVTPQSELLNRDLYLQTLSPLGTVTGVYWGEMSFDTELRGIGSVPVASAPLREDPIFLACGLSASYGAGSAVYKPFSDFASFVSSATIYAYLDGLLHVMVGVRGNMQMAGTVGQYGKFTWTLSGAVGTITYPAPAMPMAGEGIRDAALPSPTYQAFSIKPPALLGAATNLIGGTECIQALNFNMNNTVSRRDCMGAASGIAGFMVTARAPGGTVNPEAVPRSAASGVGPSTNDYWGKWRNNIGGPITFHAGNVVGNQIDWSMPNSQFNRIGYGDRNGIRTFEIEYAANATTSAGDDEVQIAYK